MDYDVLILGGGLEGCAIAYELSKYNLNIALIEKNYDIAHDIAHINTAVIYDGIENDNTLVSKLESMGNKMMDKISSKFNVPFKRCGTLYIARNKEEEKRLEEIYNRSVNRGIKDIKILEKEYVYAMEPNLKIDITKALFSKRTGVICPYDLALAYGEIAFDNNVNFKLEEEVLDIKKITKGFKVITTKNKFNCKIVVNTISSNHYDVDKSEIAYKEKTRKLKYFMLDSKYDNNFSNIIFSLSEEDNSIYTLSNTSGKTMGAVSTESDTNNVEILEKFSNLIEDVSFKDIKSFYESPFYSNEIIIDDSDIDSGYIKVVGKHYALVTMTPALASIVCETIVSNINCKLKKGFIDKRREYFKFNELTDEEKMNIIKMDKRYGKIVCTCNKISEGEIIGAIRRPLGARTIEGIKRRTGASFGTCYGSQCMSKIMSILARETNKKMTDIVKDSKNSKMVLNRVKEFDSM